MASDFEGNSAELIRKIDEIDTELMDFPVVREQLTTIKKGVQNLCKRAIAEYRRIELTESPLQERENYNKVLFEQSHQPIVVVDPEVGCFIDANRAAAKIFGTLHLKR